MSSGEPRDKEFYWVDTAAQWQSLLAAHADEEFYGIDTEFMMGKTYYSVLALIQIGWSDCIALVDPLVVDPRALAPLFDSPATALGHATSNDFDILDDVVGCRPRQLFDTQIAAQLLGWKTPSLASLTKELLDIELDKSEQRTDWLRRPLSDAALIYAASDVAFLDDLSDVLRDRLATTERSAWCREECDAVLTRSRSQSVPEELWWRVSGVETVPASARLALQRLCIVRDEWGRVENVPPTFITPDATLIAIATSHPTTVDQVRQMARAQRRPTPTGFCRDVVDELGNLPTEATDELRSPPDYERDPVFSALLKATAQFASKRATEIAIDHQIFVTRRDLIAYLNGRPSRIAQGWRRDIFTNELDAFVTSWTPPPVEEPTPSAP